MKKILFVTSEVYPLIKTGGLADVSGSLPMALRQLGHDVRILVPGYRPLLDHEAFRHATILRAKAPRLIETRLPQSEVPVLALEDALHFGREGNPYLGPDGHPWSDNAERFAHFCHVAVDLALDRLGLDWKPDLVHANDWQTGLIPALLADEPKRPATLFTIHNLAYQGIFPRSTFDALKLPNRFFSPEALEYYGQMSFIKGGIVFADRISTVSPTYATEIQTPQTGFGLEGLLSFRSQRLSGILNGIDTDAWNPAKDPYLEQTFDAASLKQRHHAKTVLQRAMGLPLSEETPLLGWVGRLVEQKGIDLLLEALPRLMAQNLQIALIGNGDPRFERILSDWHRLFPDRLAIHLGYDEALAHRAEAGCDIFLMPSRFEPCGLNQMYSQRYGAVPLVRRTGGLADTVVDATPENLEMGIASGIMFEGDQADDLYVAIERALGLFSKKRVWQSLQKTGMHRDFSWELSARSYLELYDLAEQDQKGTP